MVSKRTWKSMQNKQPRFSDRELFEAIDFMRRVKARFSHAEMLALGYNKNSVDGWYTGRTIPRDETLAKLKELLDDTP